MKSIYGLIAILVILVAADFTQACHHRKKKASTQAAASTPAPVATPTALAPKTSVPNQTTLYASAPSQCPNGVCPIR